MDVSPRSILLARLLAAAVSVLVLFALATTPMSPALLWAALLTVGGFLVMGWLERLPGLHREGSR